MLDSVALAPASVNHILQMQCACQKSVTAFTQPAKVGQLRELRGQQLEYCTVLLNKLLTRLL